MRLLKWLFVTSSLLAATFAVLLSDSQAQQKMCPGNTKFITMTKQTQTTNFYQQMQQQQNMVNLQKQQQQMKVWDDLKRNQQTQQQNTVYNKSNSTPIQQNVTTFVPQVTMTTQQQKQFINTSNLTIKHTPGQFCHSSPQQLLTSQRILNQTKTNIHVSMQPIQCTLQKVNVSQQPIHQSQTAINTAYTPIKQSQTMIQKSNQQIHQSSVTLKQNYATMTHTSTQTIAIVNQNCAQCHNAMIAKNPVQHPPMIAAPPKALPAMMAKQPPVAPPTMIGRQPPVGLPQFIGKQPMPQPTFIAKGGPGLPSIRQQPPVFPPMPTFIAKRQPIPTPLMKTMELPSFIRKGEPATASKPKTDPMLIQATAKTQPVGPLPAFIADGAPGKLPADLTQGSLREDLQPGSSANDQIPLSVVELQEPAKRKLPAAVVKVQPSASSKSSADDTDFVPGSLEPTARNPLETNTTPVPLTTPMVTPPTTQPGFQPGMPAVRKTVAAVK